MWTDIILLDIPSTLKYPVSPYTWKVRMVLNFKKLKFREQWVATVQIEATCKALGIKPTGRKPDGSAHYTLPALVDRTVPSSIVALSDSTPIVEYLERTYPPTSPDLALFPMGTREIQLQFSETEVGRIIKMVPHVAVNAHLASKIAGDKEVFVKKFEGLFGKPFSQIEKTGQQREVVWTALEQHFRRLRDAVDTRKDGHFVMGDKPRFVDFALCGAMMFIRCISSNDGWVRISAWHGGLWARYFDAMQKWVHLSNVH